MAWIEEEKNTVSISFDFAFFDVGSFDTIWIEEIKIILDWTEEEKSNITWIEEIKI